MIRRLIAYGILLTIIAYVGSTFLAPIVLCWQANGVWDNQTEMCSIGGNEISGPDLVNPHIQDVKDTVTNRIDPSKLREVIIKIPNAGETTATLARTNDALARLMASFPQEGTNIDGYAEAEASRAIVDQETGLALVPFFVNYGGTGSFVYVGLFSAGTSTMEHLDSIMIGDRIGIESVSFERSGSALKAVVLYKDRRATDAMAVAPSVPKKLVVPIEHQAFGEATVFDRTVTYTATYKDVLKLETPGPQQNVGTPLTVRGMARGMWFFEAAFPIMVTDWDGRIIGEGYAQAVGDWMTEEYVPFEATISYNLPVDTPYRRGTLILKKDNPSGLPENDDAFEIPINFK